MTDEDWVERLKLLKPNQINELAECLLDYGIVMPGGLQPNEIEAALLIKIVMTILAGIPT